jgi:hypothetical protein
MGAGLKRRLGMVLIGSLCLVSPALAQPTEKLFRAIDERPRVDPAELEKSGIRVFESKRLRLFSDIDPKVAESLPPLVDQIYGDWEKYFGKLPPARDGAEFQINGYLIKEKERFERVGLLKAGVLDEFHGRQVGYEFWMMDQATDYYRRHLLLHEATHAYMLAFPNLDLPVSYLEGMAEHFGTHRLSEGKLRTRLMPDNREDFRGHDRLFLIRRDVKGREIPAVFDIGEWQPQNFRRFNESYAWAWGATIFFDQNPRTRERFARLAKTLTNPRAWRTFVMECQPDVREISTEWSLFAADAWEGYDFERLAIDFRDGKPLTQPHRVEIQANRGWQASGVRIAQGDRLSITATGQFTLADKPKPWVSEADGITFRYHNGRPLGQLLATIRPTDIDPSETREPMLDVHPLGSTSVLKAARTGTLYLRIHEHPGELADNRGQVTVEIRRAE